MDENTRRVGVDECMARVLHMVHDNRLMPAVLLAVTLEGELAILPCGPCPRDVVMDFLRRTLAAVEKEP